MITRVPASESGRRAIEAKIDAGERLTRAEGESLFQVAELPWLGELASRVRDRLHPEGYITYIIDRNINPTNVCVARCSFCAFDRLPGDPEGYVLPKAEIFRKIEEVMRLGGVQILMQGGHHPKLGVDYFEDLFRSIKARYKIHLHALSPPEVVHVSRVSKVSIGEALDRLIAAGLNSIPGGGAEILVDRVRAIVAPHKATTDEWLGVMQAAHERGLKTTATMMFGHVETTAERIEHLLRVRELQDQTRGFTAFIPWTFQPGGDAELKLAKVGGYEYLRTLAISRLMLDNVANVQTSFITQGEKISQLGLFYGANDYGSAMLEENVVRSAGTDCMMTIADIERSIVDAGFMPMRRNMFYEIIEDRSAAAAERESLTPC